VGVISGDPLQPDRCVIRPLIRAAAEKRLCVYRIESVLD
jgi:hypothetical protein